MPKLFEYFGLIIFFYSNEHEPIHVHGFYQGFESKAELVIVDGVIKNILVKPVPGKRPLRAKALRDFELLVAKFSDEIVSKWVDYFVYNKSIKSKRITRRLK